MLSVITANKDAVQSLNRNYTASPVTLLYLLAKVSPE